MSTSQPTHPSSTDDDHTDAGFWLRVGAKLIDHALFGILEVVFVGIGAYLNALGHPPWLIGSGFVVSTILWYVYVFEMTRRCGQTLGKMAANIRVVGPEGSPPDAPVMGRRIAIEFTFDMAPVVMMAVGWALAAGLGLSVGTGAIVGGALGTIVSLLNPLWILRSPRRQAVHDLVAGTRVLRVAEVRMKAFVLAAIVAAILPEATTFGIVRPFLVEAYFVPSSSMKPTIQTGDRILANKLVPRLRPPRHYEIVMFRPPEWVSNGNSIFVKRVVGVAGDRLRVEDEKLYRNDMPVVEPYLTEPPLYTWPPEAERGDEITVPDDTVVVLGDNRNNSHDSHHWTRESPDGNLREPAPFLPVSAIRGKLVYRYWPPNRMGMVAQEELDRENSRPD